MNRLKPSLTLVLAGLGAAVLALEIGLLRREQMQARKAMAVLTQKKQERDRLLHQSPAPSMENEKAIANAVAEAARTLAELRDEFGENQAQVPVPSGPVEAFFEFSQFVAAMRRKAEESHVTMKPAEGFGFSSYANEGPADALLPAIHRQYTLARQVMEALLEARPSALLAFRREWAGPKEDGRADRGGEDYFTLPREYSVRQSGLVETDAFRVEFTGQTAVLRQFLNALAASPEAMVVRTVEVEPAGVTAGSAGGEVVALHRPQISRFAVTLEIPRMAQAGTSP
jgi:hypothetical protein